MFRESTPIRKTWKSKCIPLISVDPSSIQEIQKVNRGLGRYIVQDELHR